MLRSTVRPSPSGHWRDRQRVRAPVARDARGDVHRRAPHRAPTLLHLQDRDLPAAVAMAAARCARRLARGTFPALFRWRAAVRESRHRRARAMAAAAPLRLPREKSSGSPGISHLARSDCRARAAAGGTTGRWFAWAWIHPGLLKSRGITVALLQRRPLRRRK